MSYPHFLKKIMRALFPVKESSKGVCILALVGLLLPTMIWGSVALQDDKTKKNQTTKQQDKEKSNNKTTRQQNNITNNVKIPIHISRFITLWLANPCRQGKNIHATHRDGL